MDSVVKPYKNALVFVAVSDEFKDWLCKYIISFHQTLDNTFIPCLQTLMVLMCARYVVLNSLELICLSWVAMLSSIHAGNYSANICAFLVAKDASRVEAFVRHCGLQKCRVRHVRHGCTLGSPHGWLYLQGEDGKIKQLLLCSSEPEQTPV